MYQLRKRGQLPTAVASELDSMLAWLGGKIDFDIADTVNVAITSGSVTYSQIQEVSAAARLLGRGSASGAGVMEEIALGSRLSMSGTTLNAVAVLPFLQWTPGDNQPPAANAATAATRNAHPVLAFDGATDEEAVFGGVLPTHYAGGGVTCELWIGFTSATTGTARWQAAIERITSTLDIDADNFAAFQSAGVTAPATSGQFTKAAITFTNGSQMASLAAGEAFRLKVRRDADGTSGTDDITSDAELLRVVLRET